MDPNSAAATIKQEEWSVGRLLSWTDQFLAQKRFRSPRLDAELLLAFALGCTRMELYTRYNELAEESSRRRFRELIRKRAEGCPVAYLVGRKEFFSLSFEVNPSVLIPRPATETLVMECLKLMRDFPAARLLDVATGSGNIAIAIAHQENEAAIAATDTSPAALEVARRNAAANKVNDRIRFFQGDLFEPVPEGEKFHFIVSNPPYVARSEWERLEVNVRNYEPRAALDGGEQGLDVIERLIRDAPNHLQPGGYLMFEMAPTQDEAVRGLMKLVKGYEVGTTFVDSDGLPRVAWARWTGE
jgi:release factor glutamine methyltransferase